MPQPKARKSKLDCLVAKVASKISNCIFCNRSADDEVMYGKLYEIGDIACHYFCALLSSCLIQSGDDEDGLFGFLYSDIVAEAQRGKKYKCSYCFRGGATLGCNISQCKKQFHLPCGREHNAVSLFYGNYKSFCGKHAPKQKIPPQIMMKANQRLQIENRLKKKKMGGNQETRENEDLEEIVCVICYEAVPGYPSTETFWLSCCGKDAWFHRMCLQRMSLASGMHYLKCPLCNDKDNFYRAVLEQGYYVPDRDAAWELEANAFAEIYERPSACAAAQCRCCLGREHDADDGLWELKLCLLCGSSCVHGGCLSPQLMSGHYVCALCQTVEPPDLDRLAATAVAAASTTQGEGTQTVRRGPPVPSRMSLRRTKKNCTDVRKTAHLEINPLNMIQGSTTSDQNTTLEPSSSKENNNKDLTSDRLELNLKTPKPYPACLPKYIEDEPLKDTSNIMSPTKVIEESLKDKIMQMDIQDMSVVDTKNLIEEVRQKFKKPRPLSAKRRVVSEILENLLNKVSDVNPKIQDEVVTSQSDTPKISDGDELEIKPLEGINEEDNIKAEQKAPKEDKTADSPIVSDVVFENGNDPDNLEHDEDTKSTFELPSEFIADYTSDVSLEAFETPKKLRPVCIDNNSTIEISEKNEGVNIDVFEVHTEVNTKDATNGGDVPQTDAKSKKDSKCILKFSPLNKEVLHNKNVDIDLEVFKSQYLNEVDRRSYKCVFSHRHEEDNDNAQNTIRSVIDFAVDATVKKCSKNEYDIGKSVKVKPSGPVKRKFKEEDEEVESIKVKSLHGHDKECSKKADYKVRKIENQKNKAPRDIRQDGDIEVGELRRDKVKRNKMYSKKLRESKADNAVVDSTKKSADIQKRHKKRGKGETKKLMHSKKLKIRLKEKAKTKNRKKNIRSSAENENRKMKQTVLVFGSNDKILKSPIDMKCKKTKSNIKSPDNFKQMSLDNFFVLKIPV